MGEGDRDTRRDTHHGTRKNAGSSMRDSEGEGERSNSSNTHLCVCVGLQIHVKVVK